MNIELLRKVQKDILKVPDRFNMDFFGEAVNAIDTNNLHTVIGNPQCKTQACIAGEACLISKLAYIDKRGGLKFKRPGQDWAIAARRVLKLTSDQAKRLFYFKDHFDGVYGWPEKFREQYRDATTPHKRAVVAVARIEHFIKTKGKE